MLQLIVDMAYPNLFGKEGYIVIVVVVVVIVIFDMALLLLIFLTIQVSFVCGMVFENSQCTSTEIQMPKEFVIYCSKF